MTTVATTNLNQSRKLLWGLALLYLAFVIYGSLVPLRLVPIPLDQAIERFRSIPWLRLDVDSRADWVANLLLFMPLTFLWSQVLLARLTSIGKWCGYPLVAASAALLACAIEFTQIYFPQRTVSLNDIFAETLGGIIGIAACALVGHRVEQTVEMLWVTENRTTRITRLLHLYLLVLLAFSILPLDLTISPIEIYHKWLSGKVVLLPFRGLKGGLAENLYELITDMAIWIPPGILWFLERRTSTARIAAYGLAASLMIEVAQLFVFSRVTDLTDVLTALTGSAIGGWIGQLVTRRSLTLHQPGPVFWHAMSGVWLLVILCVFWFPFDFRLEGFSIATAMKTMMRAPFTTYYFGTEFHATNELLRKIGFFLPLGLLLGMGISPERWKESRGAKINRLITITLAALTVEVVQYSLPNKTSDLTDMVLEFFGGMLGLYCSAWILASRGESKVSETTNSAHSVGMQTVTTTGTRRDRNETTPDWKRHAMIFGALLLAVAIGTRLPFIPYNVRELNASGLTGVFSTIGLSCAIYWISTGHFLFLRWARQSRMLLLPAWILVHAIITWILLRTSVPLESIYDIVGSPVLGWPWEWEMIGRYVTLHATVALGTIGAILVTGLTQRRTELSNALIWLMTTLLLSWPLHWAIVAEAATDNLTELMRNGGSFLNSLLLGAGLLALFVSASQVASILARDPNRLRSFVLIPVSSVMASASFWFGSEQVIVKYGKVFSAWQFLLSTDRGSYVTELSLVIRFAVAYTVAIGLIGILQSTWVTSNLIRSNAEL